MFRIILLLLALAAGGSAAGLALTMKAEAPVTTIVQAAPQIPMQEILVAAADLEQGQPLGKESLRWQSWPESGLNGSYVTRSARPEAIEAAAGMVARGRIVNGEPILDEKLARLNGGFLSAMLPAGKRAVAVRISAENTAGGFILPNDRVDVLHTASQEGQNAGGKVHASRTILRNVRVLAIDQALEGAGDKAKASAVGKTATLELDPPQGEIVTASEATGTLSLALRSAADNAEIPAVIPQPSGQTVRIVRGGRSEFVKTQ